MAATDILIASMPQQIHIGSGGYSTHDLDASNDQFEVIFQAPEAAVINELGFHYYERHGTPPPYVIQLEGVNLTTGRANGTVKGATNNCKKIFTPPADTTWDYKFKWPGTTVETYTCTRGELLALVVKYSSGTVDASNFSSVQYSFSNMPDVGLPCSNTVNAGTATRRSGHPLFGFRSASKTFGFPMEDYIQAPFSSDSTPDEYAMRFVIPSGIFTSFELGYVDLYIQPPAAGKTIKVVLYSGTTVLQDVTIDSDAFGNNASRVSTRVYFDETTLATLTPGTAYRVSIQAQDTSTSVQLEQHLFAANADLDALPMGIECYLSTRTDAGAWTDFNKIRPRIDLGITNITSSGGGGGAGIMRNSDMGGLR